MSSLRAPLAGMIDQCFPVPQSRPITVRDAFEGVKDDGTGERVGAHTKIYQAMRYVRPGGTQPDHFSHQRLHPDQPSPTIRKGMNGICHYHLWHPHEQRVITLAECKRIASFGDAFQFTGNTNVAWERIGNSVPPLFMRSIAWQIRAALFGGPPLVPYAKTMSYPEILEQAWAQHLAPRAPDAPTVISTFAGCGGSSLGYSMAGYRELLAVEWDQNAVDTFRLNFPGVPVYHGDITQLSVEECLRLAGIAPGELDVLDGSPPCQGFSTAGKREMADPRNQLFREYVRLLRGLQPKVFIMENVSGMVEGRMKLVFADVMRELKSSGYKVSARLMNTMYFDVPQSRERMIFIGVRNDIHISPTHPRGQQRPRTIAEAITPPMGTIGYITASNERHCLAKRLPLRYFNQPMATLVKTGNSRMMQPWNIAPITAYEAARFGSFPDQYQWMGNEQQRIGNSVPPLFMRAIAEHIAIRVLHASD